MGESAGDPAEGTMIGPYRILRKIGGGGMGVVYEAADDALERTVALKVISSELAGSEEFRRRFTREARALAALDSPHVVGVHAHGETAGRLWLATQLVPDGDLGAMLRQYGAPPPQVALDLMSQVAAGLADAHAAGLVHRDIKPGNVLLRRRGATLTAYLGDFGVAGRLGGDGGDTDDPYPAGTVGTPAYMAPELHSGAGAGVASDVYALGCLLWTTLTGHAPYPGTTEDEVVTAHLERPVPQLPGTSALVAEANRILRTTMAKDPADRYRSAAELRDDLRRAGSPAEATPVPAGPHRSRPALAAAVAVLAGVLAVAAVVGAGGPPHRDDPARATENLTRALVADDVLTRAQAECVAARWVADVGLEQLVAEGYFTDDMAYVDVDIDRVSRRTRRSLTTASVGCLRQP